MQLLFVDIEASGLHLDSYPIEFAVLDENGKIHEWLIKPLQDWSYWDPRAELIHGISRETLAKKGMEPALVATELNKRFRRKVLYSDAQQWDLMWTQILFYDTRIKLEFEIHAIQSLMSSDQIKQFARHKEQLSMQGKIKHRAADDAKQLALISQRFIGNGAAGDPLCG